MDGITAILERIGLTKGESKVYLALLELRSSTTGKIIEKSRVSASKVYEILDKLLKKGLVSYLVKDKTRIYTAQDPKSLMDFLNLEEKRIEDNKLAVKGILPELLLKLASGSPEPSVQVFEGKRGFILSHDKLVDEIKQGGSYYTIALEAQNRMFSAYFKEWNKKRQAKNIGFWVIYDPGAWFLGEKRSGREKLEERKVRKNYFPKVCDNKGLMPANITFANDLCMLSLISDEIICILIRNKSMVDSYKSYFKSMWELAETPKGYSEFKGELF